MGYKWTPEAVQDYEKRMERLREEGKVKTHRIAIASERNPSNMARPNPGPKKYHNEITVLEGIKFHSKKEADRYGDLRLLEKAKEISKLKLQVKFLLVIDGEQVSSYIADFTYLKAGKLVVEDVKGFKTEGYRLKKKLMAALHKIEILET